VSDPTILVAFVILMIGFIIRHERALAKLQARIEYLIRLHELEED